MMPTTPTPDAPRSWFGTYTVPEGRVVYGRLGPLQLWLAHRPTEWRIAVLGGGDPLDPVAAMDPPADGADIPPEADVQRFATATPGDKIELMPALADRPVVARPVPTMTVPAGHRVELFVSTPLWLRFSLPAPKRMLFEVPISRPADTWFGVDTQHGTLCYASRTAARLLLDNLPLLAHRVVTRVAVRNDANDGLLLERLGVPMPNLTLFADRQHRLWTQSVLAGRDPAGSLGPAELGTGPPAEAIEPRLLAGPREHGAPTVLHRALQVFLG